MAPRYPCLTRVHLLRLGLLMAAILLSITPAAATDDTIRRFASAFERRCLLGSEAQVSIALGDKLTFSASAGGAAFPGRTFCWLSRDGDNVIPDVKALIGRSSLLEQPGQKLTTDTRIWFGREGPGVDAWEWAVNGAPRSRVVLFRSRHLAGRSTDLIRIERWQ